MATRIRNRNRIPQLVAQLESLSKRRVEVGLFGGGDSHLVMRARVQEFGVRIRVTDKMRAWYAANATEVGLKPLKASTKYIIIPERSFMRSTWDESQGQLRRLQDGLLNNLLDGKISASVVHERLGSYLVSQIQTKIRNLRAPSNHPLTVKRKGSSNPLINTGEMRQKITYRVVKL